MLALLVLSLALLSILPCYLQIPLEWKYLPYAIVSWKYLACLVAYYLFIYLLCIFNKDSQLRVFLDFQRRLWTSTFE
jgi:hypothetical protein